MIILFNLQKNLFAAKVSEECQTCSELSDFWSSESWMFWFAGWDRRK